jgi:6-phosphogluconate dehydrogenase (decarboxylating)
MVSAEEASAMAAVDEAVLADVLSAALYDRFRSREAHLRREGALANTTRLWWTQRG